MKGNRKRNLKRSVLLAGTCLVLLGAAGYYFGEDLLWSALTPEHAELIGERGAPDMLPAEAWQEDLRFLRRELPRRLPRFREVADSAAFHVALDTSIATIAELDRPARILNFMKLLAVDLKPGYGGGHTVVPTFQRPLNWRFYPFHAYAFEDGVWIVLSDGAAGDAVGSRILAMNGVPIEHVLELGGPYVAADNHHSRLYRLTAHLSYAGFLEGLGVVADDGRLRLLLRRPGGDEYTIDLRAMDLFSFGGLGWGRLTQGPVETWSPADPRMRASNYRFDYSDDSNVLYFHFNRVSDEDEESIEEFAGRLSAFVEEHNIDKFVIDLRSNGGGDNQLLEPLLSLISGHPKIDRRGVLYTLIGRRTYSAAGSFATALERRTRTIFAGEPSGFTPNHLGDAVTIPLPRSRVLANVSTRYWEDDGPFGRRPWTEPDLNVPVSSANHFGGRDPVLQAVLEHRPDAHAPATLSDARREELRRHLPGRYRFGDFKVLEIDDRGTGMPGFIIHGTATWARSALYPANKLGTRFATDMSGVFLEVDEEAFLWINWRGSRYLLAEMQPGESTPVEMLERLTPESPVPESPVPDPAAEVDSVVAAFRVLAARGSVPDSNVEFLINRVGYELLRGGRERSAVRLFKLQTELYPTVANAFDSLGDGFRAVGRLDKAQAAYRRALDLDPGFDHPAEMLTRIGDNHMLGS